MPSKNRAIFGILLLVFFFFLILLGFSIYTINAFKDPDEAGLNLLGGSEIAVVEVTGIIMESKNTVDKLKQALDSKNVKAIILRIDSPGGAVGPSQEIYEEVMRIDKDKEDGKPIYASLGTIAASGGYYIASATRKIYSNAGTLTGSIGVIMQFVDISRLLEWAKISSNTLKAGKYKDIGQPTRAITKEEKKLVEKLLEGVHKQFVKDVLVNRKDKIKGDIWALSQGQVFSGEEAKNAGLVDEIAGLYEAGRRIQKELGLKGEPNLKYIKKKKNISFLDFFENLDENISNLKLAGFGKYLPMFLYSSN
jgi:protease IV